MNRFQLFLLCTIHGFIHGVMNIFPIVLEPVRLTYGWSLSGISWIATIGYVSFGLMALPGGWLADRFSRWFLLKVMLAGMGLSLILMTILPTGYGFLVGWEFTCLFAGLYHPLGLSSVVTASGDNTGRSMGWFGMGGNLGLAFMPLVAGILTSMFHWQASFLFAGVLSMFLLLFGFKIKSGKISSIERDRGEEFKFDTNLILVMVLYGSVGFIYRGIVTFVPSSVLRRWPQEIGLDTVGGLTTLIFIVGAFGQLTGGWLEEKFETFYLFGSVVLVYTAGIVGLMYSSGLLFIFLLMVWALCFFAGQPILNTLLSKIGQKTTHGRLYGTAFAMNLGLGATGAGVTGSLIDYGGLRGGYVGVLSICSIVLLVTYYLSNKSIRQ